MQNIYNWVGSTSPRNFRFPTLGILEIWPSEFTTLTIENAYLWGVIVLAGRADFDPWAVSPFHSKGSGKNPGSLAPPTCPHLDLAQKTQNAK